MAVGLVGGMVRDESGDRSFGEDGCHREMNQTVVLVTRHGCVCVCAVAGCERAASPTMCSRLPDKHSALFILLETPWAPRDCLSQGFYACDERRDQKQLWGVGLFQLHF